MDRPHFRNSLSLSKSFLDDLSQDKLSILDDFQTPKRGTKLDDSFLFHSGEFSIPSGLKGRRTYSIMSETVYSGLTEDSGDTLLEYRDYCEEQSFSQPNEELLKEKSQTVVILGWDDILIPSGFLENALVRRSCSKTISTMSPLDQSASKLLSTALEYGDVIIITNSMPEWVEISGKTFIPNTYEMIMHRNITILYAKSLFESKFPQDASRWKSEAFLSLEERFDLDIPGNVICISDSENDAKAAEGLGAKFEKCSVKSIRFKKQPSIKELVSQQAFVVEGFSKIYHDEENIQINIGVNPRSWKGLSRRDMRK